VEPNTVVPPGMVVVVVPEVDRIVDSQLEEGIDL
jgi:hypothetical protein